MHSDNTKLHITLSVIEQHQQDRKQDWTDTTLEKRGDAKLRASEAVKLVIPATLQKELMDWHHKNLKHPGGNTMHLTLKQHFYWKGMKTV